MWTTIGGVCLYVVAIFFLLWFFNFVHGADERMHDVFTQSTV